jgi:alkylation response protein AidB-like acyl-CoA dehydrogenase
VHLDLTDSQKRLRSELRAYFEGLLTPEVMAELKPDVGPVFRRIVRQMGTDGWLGIGWPPEYGGQGRSEIEQFIFFDEARRARAPVPLVTLNTVGPTLMRFGTPEQRDAFLPRILRGEIHFAVGYTEAEAGTDLASLRTRAVRDGDHYVVNGNKVFTSGAEDADYIWLAVRTDPDAPRHEGISILIVDTTLPGYKFTPIRTLADNETAATYYEDVRVPVEMLVGAENEGWKLITTQLNHERIALGPPGEVDRAYEETLRWARQTGAIDQPWVRLNLARVHAKLEALKLLNYRVAWGLGSGDLNPADASALKVFGTEFYVEAYRLLGEILGEAGYYKEGSPGAAAHGNLERNYRRAVVFTFGGGVNEIQREIIAMAGLRMPRAKR